MLHAVEFVAIAINLIFSMFINLGPFMQPVCHNRHRLLF